MNVCSVRFRAQHVFITCEAKKVDPRVAMGFMKNPPKFLLIGMSLASSKPTTLRGVDNRGLMDTKHRVELGQKLMRRELRKSKPKTVKTYTCPKCIHEAGTFFLQVISVLCATATH